MVVEMDVIVLTLLTIVGLAVGVAALVVATRRQAIEPSAYVTMEQAYQSQQERLERQSMRIEALEARTIEQDARIKHLEDGVTALIDQLHSAKMDPVWTPEGWTRRINMPPQNKAELRQRLKEQFTIDELDSLAFDLGISRDELSGETLDARVRSLMTYVERRGHMNELVAAVMKERPGK